MCRLARDCVAILEEGIEQNVPWCYHDLGFCYLYEDLELRQDDEIGLELLKSAAAKGYRPKAKFYMQKLPNKNRFNKK